MAARRAENAPGVADVGRAVEAARDENRAMRKWHQRERLVLLAGECGSELARRPRGVELFAAYLRDIVHRLTGDRDATLALFELRIEAARKPSVAEAVATWLRTGLDADVAFNTQAGLPGGRWEIVLFHYALDGLILDQLTVPIDEEVDADHAVGVLVER